MPEQDAIIVCTLSPEDDKATEPCPVCHFGKGPGHAKRRPITRDLVGVPTDQPVGRPVFDPFDPRP